MPPTAKSRGPLKFAPGLGSDRQTNEAAIFVRLVPYLITPPTDWRVPASDLAYRSFRRWKEINVNGAVAVCVAPLSTRHPCTVSQEIGRCRPRLPCTDQLFAEWIDDTRFRWRSILGLRYINARSNWNPESSLPTFLKAQRLLSRCPPRRSDFGRPGPSTKPWWRQDFCGSAFQFRHELRNLADYDPSRDFTPDEARVAISDARQAIVWFQQGTTEQQEAFLTLLLFKSR